MAVSTNMRLFILLLVAVAKLSATAEFDSAENVETFLNSIFQLSYMSDTFTRYATQVQTLFCPEQPICSDIDDKNRTDILRNLSVSMGYNKDGTRAEDLSNAIKACCFPCSCDVKTCTEDGNCCPSKFSDAVSDKPELDAPNENSDVSDTDISSFWLRGNATNKMYSECIKAVRDSYEDKDVIHLERDHTIPSYFMITQCFGNNASNLTIQKCHRPSGNEFEETVPVTSSDTRRIYWNTHCARCNNDGSNIVPWNSTVRFDFDIAYFYNHTNQQLTHYPEKPDDILKYISKSGYILFTPPIPMGEKLCIRKNLLITSMRSSIATTNTTEMSWIHQACDHIYGPFIVKNIFGIEYPFQNVFCYLLNYQNVKLDLSPSEKKECEFTIGQVKSSSRQITAMLDYKALTRYTETDMNTETERANNFGLAGDQCGCDEIYDANTHICRRLYCPAGDFMIGCRCVQLIKAISGMPILITIKVIPRDGHLTALDDKQISKVHVALRKRMRDISENISIDFISMYEIKTVQQEYFLSLAIVRSFPGSDTKDTMKPFLDNIDKNPFEIAYKRNSFYGKLTSRVRVWEQGYGGPETRRLQDLESAIRNQTELFSKADTALAFRQKIQALSPLLYCMQIQLNDTEFDERDDGLIVDTSLGNIKIFYYRHVTPSLVRVCVDSLININNNTGYQMSLSLYVLVLALAKCVAISIFQ